jgi:hypothetical protein
MAITAAQQLEIYKLTVGMFGAAPGLVITDQLAEAIEAGVSITQIYNILANSPAFQAQGFGFTNAATNEQFAAAFADKLLGSAGTATTEPIVASFVLAQLNSGQSRGQAMQTTITALTSIPTTDATLGAASALVQNQVAVAKHFTEVVGSTSTDLNVLRNAIAPVTSDPASVAATQEANLGTAGATLNLTTAPDNVVGTSFADQIFGVIDLQTAANNTFTATDIVNAGASTADKFNITVLGNVAGALPPAQVSNTEQFFIRDINTGGASTYNFALIQGENLVANDRSTQAVTFDNLAAGTTVEVQGDNVTLHGATTFKMESNTAAVNLNIDGGVKQGNITRNNTGAATVTVNSLGVDNTVGVLDLDTGTALTGLTINASGADLTAQLAADYAAGAKLTVLGANDVDLLGAALSANFTSVDASAQTGGSTKVLLGAVGTSFTGGAGNDVVAVDALVFNAAGKLDGGTGINTVRVSDAAALTAATAANMTNFQVLRLADDNDGAADTFNTSLISGIVAIEIDAQSAGDGVVVNNLNATRAAAVTIRGNQVVGPVFGVTGATTVGQLDVLGISINDGATAKNTITVADVTAAGVETVNFNLTDNLVLTNITGLTALTNMNVTGAGNFTLNSAGGLALNVNTQINASGATGTVTIDASGFTVNGAALVGSLTKVNTITGTGQADVISGGSANDSLIGTTGIDTVNISQGGDDIVSLNAITAATDRDIFTGFNAGAFTAGSGNDRVEVTDTTTAFSATSGTFQVITSAPTATTTFTTATANVLELAFDLTGNGGANDLDNSTDGTGLLASLGQTLAVSADQNTGYILAYQEGKAYLYRAAESNDAGADLAAADITLVGRFDAVAVGAFDATNFIDAV